MRYILFSLLILAVFVAPAHATWWDINATAKTNFMVENIAGATLTDFPFNVTWNTSGQTKSCIDPVFVNQSETEKLYYELENNTCTLNNNSVYWVRMSSIAAGNHTIYAYHNFTTPTDQSDKTSTWDSDYEYVFHFGEMQSAQYNSVPFLNGSLATAGTGVGLFGRGLTLDGTSSASPGDTGLLITNGWTAALFDNKPITIEMWVKFNDSAVQNIFGISSANCELTLVANNAGAGNMRIFAYNATTVFDASPAVGLTTGTWQYLVLKYDRARAMFYVDGVNVANITAISDKRLCTTTNDLLLGSGGGGGYRNANATFEEYRISTVNRSDASIKATFNKLRTTIGVTEALAGMNININAFYPNGTAANTFNVSIENATNTIQINDSTNPLAVHSITLPQGNVTFNVSAVGYDSETWNIIVNETNPDAQQNFTLYPLSYVTFFDNVQNADVGGWIISIPESGINYSVDTIFIVSNRNLTVGSNIISASRIGYLPNSTAVAVVNSTSFNVTINTSVVGVTIEARDEITQQNIPFNMNLYLKSTNTTLVSMTAMRAGLICMYDGDESSGCITLTGSGVPLGQCVNFSTIQAQDYTDAVFTETYDFASAGATDHAQINVYIGNVLIYTNKSYVSGTGLKRFFFFNNSNSSRPKAVNFTVQLCAQTTSSNVYDTKEFRMTANSAGYTYVDDFKITFPLANYTGFTTYDSWFTGEETYNPDYSVARMFRFTISAGADFDVVAYLINNSLSTVYTQFFNILDGTNIPIPGALMTLQKWYGGIRTTVAQCEANIAGACSFPLQKAIEYAVSVVVVGFETFERQSTVFTGLPNPQNVFLEPTGVSNFTSVYDNIVIAIEPNDEYQHEAFNTTCTLIASDGNLNWINFTLQKYVNSTFQFYASNYTNTAPSGGAIRFEVTDTGRYRVQCEFQWVSNATGTPTTYQDFYSQNYWIYNDMLQNAAPGLVNPLLGMLFTIGAIILICVPLSRLDVTLATAASIIIMIISGFTGFVGWDVAGLSSLTAIAFIMLRRSP